jgi:hypothetical protein
MKPTPRNVALDLFLTLLLCGIWNAVVQYKQIETLNYLLKKEQYSFWKVYLFTVLTCGIYLIFHEYQKAVELAKITGKERDSDPILAVVLSLLGFSIVFDAIVQSKLNEILDQQAALEATSPDPQ